MGKAYSAVSNLIECCKEAFRFYDFDSLISAVKTLENAVEETKTSDFIKVVESLPAKDCNDYAPSTIDDNEMPRATMTRCITLLHGIVPEILQELRALVAKDIMDCK